MFDTTHWSLVRAAGGDDSAAARTALAALCESYWYPLYAFIRRRGASPDDARDLTQGFLTSLIRRDDFRSLDPAHGRFRAFLLASLKHFLSNERARERTAKRGGHVTMRPLSMDDAEGRYRVEPTEPATPETLYERRWALTVIERVLADLRGEWLVQQREADFDALKACLLGEAPPGGYASVARQLGSSEGAVKVAVHRLRRRFQTKLRQRIAETVSDPAEVDDEIRYLVRVLNA